MVSSPQMIGHGAQAAESDGAVAPSAASQAVDVGTSAEQEIPATTQPAPAAPRLDPTRYGDWERNGRCIDF